MGSGVINFSFRIVFYSLSGSGVLGFLFGVSWFCSCWFSFWSCFISFSSCWICWSSVFGCGVIGCVFCVVVDHVYACEVADCV